ncbi:MAG: ABC transporter ATP-binding protein [Fimbriimonadales bacterium]|nr:MAG: ABC transporter ATP-binding protein [Fimbriimonadales bacterium]
MVARVRNLSVAYGKTLAVADATCEIPEGCVGLLGPNGAGKTTLIKALLGFLRPTDGEGEVLGYDIRAASLELRLHVGLMPESDCHIPGLSAVEYVALAGELSGMPRANALQRAHEVLEYCGLGEARYRNVETFSTGMKQKAKIAQALVHGPRLLFLDEPTNGLDPESREEMLDLIRDISHNKGVNCIVSSHLLPDIERTCDWILVMSQGRIRSQKSVTEMRGESARQWDVELKDASDAFATAVQAKGAALLKHVSNLYRVEVPDDADPALFLLSLARETGAEVRSLRPASRTLEEAFLEVLG